MVSAVEEHLPVVDHPLEDHVRSREVRQGHPGELERDMSQSASMTIAPASNGPLCRAQGRSLATPNAPPPGASDGQEDFEQDRIRPVSDRRPAGSARHRWSSSAARAATAGESTTAAATSPREAGAGLAVRPPARLELGKG